MVARGESQWYGRSTHCELTLGGVQGFVPANRLRNEKAAPFPTGPVPLPPGSTAAPTQTQGVVCSLMPSHVSMRTAERHRAGAAAVLLERRKGHGDDYWCMPQRILRVAH